MTKLTVDDVAARLGVSSSRVRAQIASGILPAEKLGARWVLDSEPVDVVAASKRSGGRPLSARMAWGLIALAEGRQALGLSAPERSRLRSRLRQQPPLADIAYLARKRATTRRLHVHRGVVGRASQWPGAVRTGVSAAGHDLVQISAAEIYLPAAELNDLVRTLRARPTAGDDANVVVHVPDAVEWPLLDEAGPVTVAFDLWDAGDARSRRTAERLYRNALAARSWEMS